MADTNFIAPLFGMSITPATKNARLAFNLAQVADSTKLDFLTMQDHPYNPTFLDTWTLLTALGITTQHVHLLPNVANLPLRPPAMLAKEAATLDILTNGRVEMGLGAGGFWDGIVSYGGPRRTPGEAVGALEEAIQVMKALWAPTSSGQAISFEGKYYQLHGAQAGPMPLHPIGIWLGALRPRMLELTGRMADGWIISAGYIPPEQVPSLQAIIDEAAQRSGRAPAAIRRAYNLAGSIQRSGSSTITARRKGVLVGPVSQWADTLLQYYTDLRMDTFIFWPIGDEETQIRTFAEEVVPAVRSGLMSR